MVNPAPDEDWGTFEPQKNTIPTSLSISPRHREHNSAILLWIFGIGLVCLVMFLVLFATTGTRVGGSIIPSVGRPRWQRAVVSYIQKNEPLLEVERFYPPESMNNAKIYFPSAKVWFDTVGEYSGLIVNADYNPGTGGYIDATCQRGVRVEYTVDEGFARSSSHDCVFFLTADDRVTGFAPTEKVRFIGVEAADQTLKDVGEIFSRPMKN